MPMPKKATKKTTAAPVKIDAKSKTKPKARKASG